MVESSDKDQGKKKVAEVKTFLVPFPLRENQGNITIKTNTPPKPSKEQLINQAFKFHSQGNISEAIKYYQHFINQGFKDYRVFSNYGSILKSLGKLREAEFSTRKAIEIKPDFANAHYSLGNILIDLGKSQEAEISYRKAIELKPDFAEAHSNLGNILRDLGNRQEAEISYRKAIDLKPDFAIVHSNLGNILRDLGKLQEAEISYRKAIELKPDFADAHSNLGNILKDLGNRQEAEISYRKAIEIKPDYPEAHSNLGNILRDLGKLQEAEISYRKAIELKPDFAYAHCNLGNTLKDLGNLQEAEISYRKAIELNPNFADAHSNLGNILRDLGKEQEAEISYRKAIKIKPDYSGSYYNLGNLLAELGNLQESEISYRKAIELKPDFLEANWGLYLSSNDIDQAEERLKECLKIDNKYIKAELHLSAVKLHKNDQSCFKKLRESPHSDSPIIKSIQWVSSLPKVPEVFFHRYSFYDAMINQSIKTRPFYEFGVYKGSSFKYLIKTFKKGYGFDTFEGLPENWDRFKKGSFSAQGTIPKIDGGTFTAGMFEDTLPTFFSKPRPIASIINFDADLYSSTICALNYSKPIIDQDTILIFDEFIVHENWELDEYRAFNEFCSKNNLTYEVLAVSYSTYQTAVKLIGI